MDGIKNVKPKALSVLSPRISRWSNAYLWAVYPVWLGVFQAVFFHLQLRWILMAFSGLITTTWHLYVGGDVLCLQVQSLT